MQTRELGRSGLKVSAIGLGCMGMTGLYGPSDDHEALATLNHALDRGVNFFDTSDAYGPFTNERLIAQVLKARRNEVVIATKFGHEIRSDGSRAGGVNGRPEYVRQCCEGSLQRLGVDHIDLYYQHRVDKTVPIEDTVGAMAELVKQGKVRYLGLSEASAATIRRAHAVHPIAALQTEYSLWCREVEEHILPTVRALGIGFVAYSPLGRGFLTGQFSRLEDLGPNDRRRAHPRFFADNFRRNLAIVAGLKEMAAAKGVAPAQLALAWVLAQGNDIVPIPGTKRRAYLDQNIAAVDIHLSSDERARLETIAPVGVTAGERYPDDAMRAIDR
jgi:aryl-alcohol dehydrogenase-like predicted oxidoreductase